MTNPIQINVLKSTPSPTQRKLNRAVEQFERSQYLRPANTRNPETKKIKCVGCGHRHPAPLCPLQYHIGRYDPEKRVLIAPKTRRGVLGAAAFAKRRFRPHRNQKTLLTIHIAQEMYDNYLDWVNASVQQKQPDPSRVVRDAIRAVRGLRQSFSPARRREVVAGLNFREPKEKIDVVDTSVLS